MNCRAKAARADGDGSRAGNPNLYSPLRCRFRSCCEGRQLVNQISFQRGSYKLLILRQPRSKSGYWAQKVPSCSNLLAFLGTEAAPSILRFVPRTLGKVLAVSHNTLDKSSKSTSNWPAGAGWRVGRGCVHIRSSSSAEPFCVNVGCSNPVALLGYDGVLARGGEARPPSSQNARFRNPPMRAAQMVRAVWNS
jgi:hypothetical protein